MHHFLWSVEVTVLRYKNLLLVSEKRMKNCIPKIIDNAFEKMTEVGYFLLPYVSVSF